MKLLKHSLIFFGILFISGLGLTVFQSPAENFEKTCRLAQENIYQFERKVNALSSNSELYKQIYSGNMSTEDIADYLKDDILFFVFQSDSLIFWNKNLTLPDISPLDMDGNGKLILTKNGYYIGFKRKIGAYQLIAMQLLKHNFHIENKYLSNEFYPRYPLNEKTEISTEKNKGYAIMSLNNTQLFSLKRTNANAAAVSNDKLIIGFVCLFSFWMTTWLFIYYFNKSYAPWTSYLLLLIASIVFIELIEFVNFGFIHSVLFNPALYASQYFGSSLGHLFVNAIILLFINLLIGVQYYLKQWSLRHIGQLVFSAWLILQIVLYNAILQSLILDSTISFEISNFALSSVYSYLGLTIIGMLTLGLFISLYIWAHAIYLNYLKSKYFLVLGYFVVCGMLMVYFSSEPIAALVPLVLYFHSVIFFILLEANNYENRFNHILNSLFFSSVIIASILSYYNVKNENLRKEIAANQLSENHDLITEYQFEEIQDKIKKDPYFKKFFISPFVSEKELQQRLNFLYFRGSLSRYNVSATAFNLEGKPIKTSRNVELSYFYDIINQQADDTYSEWLFLVPQSNGKNSYLSILPIENNGQVSGTLVLEFSMKTFTKENLYPELLIEQKTSPIADFGSSKEYDYGVYKSNYIVNQSGEYPFPFYLKSFELKENYPFVLSDENSELTFFQIDLETVVVLNDKRTSWLIAISTFSYIICFLGFLGFIAFIVIYILGKRSKLIPIKPLRLSFQNKINLSIALITVASFIVIGIVTIGYFSKIYKTNETDKLIKKQQAVLSSLEYYIMRENNGTSVGLPENMATEVASMAEIQGIDINFFDLEGTLKYSSQPEVFSSGLISNKINPLALHHILTLREERYIHQEQIGKLDYQSIYVPIRLADGLAIGILNMPYFAQEETLNNELSDLMVALVNVYVLLMMISILMAFIVSNSLTQPLASIAEKIGLVSISSKNEKIQWGSDDEIGALVAEYNKMIEQIEESAHALAQSERESAWREMARQIAHEIKNPLTPMKLGIQHLQRTIQDNPDDVGQLAKRVCQTMIEQIDNLSEIATAFSSFAKMPSASKEKVSLTNIIQNVVNLFNQTSKISIQFPQKNLEAWVYADKNQLLSVFNNLIKNAQQAIEDRKDPLLKVLLFEKENHFEIQVIDNGIGIPQDMANRVFVPNFTSKSSGTGLGLAISKQIIENSGGEIWFESIENNGSTFFVTIPKHSNFT